MEIIRFEIPREEIDSDDQADYVVVKIKLLRALLQLGNLYITQFEDTILAGVEIQEGSMVQAFLALRALGVTRFFQFQL